MKLPVSSLRTWSIFSLAALLFWSGSLFAQEGAATKEKMLITTDLLLPKSTCGYLSIRDISVLRDSWQQTALGELEARPDMKEFSRVFQGQLASGFSSFEKRLGVTLDDLGEIASTEITAALLYLAADRYGMAIITNVGDKQYETQSVLNRIAERVKKDGGDHQKQEIKDAEIHIFNILDPDTKNFNKAYYVLTGELLITSDRPEIVKEVLTHFLAIQSNSNAELESLSQVDAYLDILNAAIVDETLPDIIFYADPIRLMRVQRLMKIEQDPDFAKTRDSAELLSGAGFDGVEAIGGVMNVRHKGYDATQRVLISIPKEPQGSLKMLSFDSSADKELPDWITDEAGSVHIINLDMLQFFDHLGPLVNQFFGEGSDTVWDDILDGFQNDPYGPQLNLRDEVFGLLKNKLVCLIQNMDPKADGGERCLIAVPTTDAAKLKKNLGALLDEEPTFERLENGDDVCWKMIEETEGEDAGTQVKSRRFHEMTITVWDGWLLVASEPGFIDHIKGIDLATATPLSKTPNYQRMLAEANAQPDKAPHVSFHYVNSENSREHMFEMIKAGKLADSKSGRQPIEPDSSLMPDFSEVKDHFLPTAGFIFETEGGLIYQGLWMSEEKMKGESASADSADDDDDATAGKAVKTAKKAKKKVKSSN